MPGPLAFVGIYVAAGVISTLASYLTEKGIKNYIDEKEEAIKVHRKDAKRAVGEAKKKGVKVHKVEPTEAPKESGGLLKSIDDINKKYNPTNVAHPSNLFHPGGNPKPGHPDEFQRDSHGRFASFSIPPSRGRGRSMSGLTVVRTPGVEQHDAPRPIGDAIRRLFRSDTPEERKARDVKKRTQRVNATASLSRKMCYQLSFALALPERSRRQRYMMRCAMAQSYTEPGISKPMRTLRPKTGIATAAKAPKPMKNYSSASHSALQQHHDAMATYHKSKGDSAMAKAHSELSARHAEAARQGPSAPMRPKQTDHAAESKKHANLAAQYHARGEANMARGHQGLSEAHARIAARQNEEGLS